MNFLQRRKILKQANYLDLTPVRMMEYIFRENGYVDILLPRFKNKVSRNLLQPVKKGDHIHIKLDTLGSAIWKLIDGNSTVTRIVCDLEESYTEKLTTHDETIKRVTQFLSLLYQQRYISFLQILDKKSS
ncbi:MAG: PqqD family protein [Bacteroidetes bacterium]|nr:PqqD family protein [Bacteroidota bacterium]